MCGKFNIIAGLFDLHFGCGEEKTMNRNILTNILLIGLLCLTFSVGDALAQGKKYGLFVGINAYAGNELNGCVNDAKNMQQTLTGKYGFTDTVLLTDQQATRDGIIGAIKGYQAKANAGDIFVFTYSGHGTLFPDKYSEEQDEEESLEMPGYYALDKYDSAICPIDLRSNTSGKPWNNLILDDELYDLFSGFTSKGAMVVFIADSCHSGTLARAGELNTFPSKLQPRARFLPLSKIRSLNSIPKPARSRTVKRTRKDVNGLLIVLSGSKDNEFSLDYPDATGGEVNGLFTKTFLQAINEAGSTGKKATYLTVRDIVSPKVKELAAAKNNSQTPQIDGRFFSQGLDIPLFEFRGKPAVETSAATTATISTTTTTDSSAQTSDTGDLLRVVLKVTDKADQPVDGAAVGIFNQSVSRSLGEGDVGKIQPRDIRGTGRTNKKGLYDSNIQSLLLPRGTYFIKVLRDGYEPYIGEIKIVENAPGYCVLNVKLQKQ